MTVFLHWASTTFYITAVGKKLKLPANACSGSSVASLQWDATEQESNLIYINLTCIAP